jgi:hypothetical protein
VVSDLDDGTSPVEDLPDAGKSGVIDVVNDADGKPVAGADEDEEEPFSRTGWAPKFASFGGDLLESENMLDHATWVEGKLSDSLFGGKSFLSYAKTRRFVSSHAPQTGITTQPSSFSPVWLHGLLPSSAGALDGW